jgi:hypothetical protein
MKTANRNFSPAHGAHAHHHTPAHARPHPRTRTDAPASLFRLWQDADAQASAARRRVRLASVADGSGVSDADVCDALMKERRANALAEQMLERFGAGAATALAGR